MDRLVHQGNSHRNPTRLSTPCRPARSIAAPGTARSLRHRVSGSAKLARLMATERTTTARTARGEETRRAAARRCRSPLRRERVPRHDRPRHREGRRRRPRHVLRVLRQPPPDPAGHHRAGGDREQRRPRLREPARRRADPLGDLLVPLRPRRAPAALEGVARGDELRRGDRRGPPRGARPPGRAGAAGDRGRRGASGIDPDIAATALVAMLEEFAHRWFVEGDGPGTSAADVIAASETLTTIWLAAIGLSDKGDT